MICDLPDVEADRRAGVVGLTPLFGARAGALAAALCGVFGSLAAGSVGRYGSAATALGLAVIALLHLRHPERGVLRFLADGVVVVLPGPLALLFR